MRKFLTSVADFIFPRECHLCGGMLDSQTRFVCPACMAEMPRTLYHRMKDNPMERRFMGQFRYRAATGHFFYSRGSKIASLMQDLKYRHFSGLAHFLGETVASELLPTGFLSDIDYIMPLPMHFIKKARRGYNQTEIISQGISAVAGIPVASNLRAVRPHRTQTALSLEQRLLNTRDIFHVVRPEELKGKTILLVDDVCTTGATMGSAAMTLCEAAPDVELVLLTVGVTF